MSEDASRFRRRRMRSILLALSGILLLGATLTLIGIGQSAQALSRERDQRVGREAERLASVVSDHCAERQSDLRDLSGLRPLQVCFENIAHGVAPEAGLTLSFQRAELRLHRLLEEKTLNGRKLFEDATLIDARGRVLASAHTSGFSGRTRRDHRPFEPDGPWLRMAEGAKDTVLVGAPCVADGIIVGQVLASFKPAMILAGLDPGKTDDSVMITGPDGASLGIPNQPSRCPISGALSALTPGTIHTIESAEPGQKPIRCVARRVEVAGTPLSVILARPVDSPLTRSAGALSLIALAALASLAVVAVLGWRRVIARDVTFLGERESQDEQARRGQERIGELEGELGDIRIAFASLTERAQKYRNLAEMLPQTVFELDLDGRVTYVNQRGFEQFGYEPKHVEEGLLGLDMIVPEDRAAAGERIRLVLGGEKALPREYTGMRRDGSRFPALVRTSAIIKDGRPTGIRGFIVDLSSGRLVEERLRQSQKMESIGTLAAGIAHDFNNLLTGIQGQTSILLTDQATPSSCRESLESIAEHVRSASELTQQLLGFARNDGSLKRVTDLNELVQRQINLFGRTHKDLRIQTDLAPDCWTVEVDRGQIEQVLLNLCVNAAQAMPGGGRLEIRTESVTLDEMNLDSQDTPPGDYVLITVTDNGVGMDEETRRRAFDPFFTTKQKGRGTGLGLASAYSIVKKHGGIIDIASEPGLGSTFRIHLPASHRALEAKPAPAQEVRPGCESILLVDDEGAILRVGKTMLETLGYEVRVASNGSDALDRLAEANGDLVILDLVMPGMGGAETFDRIRKSYPHVRILLSSGHSPDGEAQELLERGCDGFLQKPFNLEELSTGVRAALEREPAPPATL